MAERLDNVRVAILVAKGFERSELEQPREALEEAGAEALVVSPEDGSVRAWDRTDWGDEMGVDVVIDEASADDFDALLLPGGVFNPDFLRQDERAVDLVRSFFEAGKPVAAICHGPWTIVEADCARDRTLTSYPSLRTDLRNAGANWVDEEVVVDGQLVTSRTPDDLPAFCREMIRVFSASTATSRRATG